jgi:RNA polymerase sigma-70 factor (ECF subfamily)
VSNWDRIVTEHGPVVYRTAWRILGHAADAEDVTQEVFLQACQIHRREPIRSWEALLRRLATCRALDHLRQRRWTAALREQDLAGMASNPEVLALARELVDRLRLGIARLPHREAAIFCLRCFDSLSYDEIAEVLQISTGAVGVALHKARARLEASLVGREKGTHLIAP